MQSAIAISLVVAVVAVFIFFSRGSRRKGGCKCGDGSGSCKNDMTEKH